MTSVTTLPTPAHSVNGAGHDLAMADDASPNKRKRTAEDVGDREQHKKPHLEDSKLGINDLHYDVGIKYLLCQSRKAPFFCPPHLTLGRWPWVVCQS
jgi:hypothetical protein